MRRIRLCPHWRWYLHSQGLALPRLERPEGWPGERNRWLRYQPFPGWWCSGPLRISSAPSDPTPLNHSRKTIVTRLVQEVNLSVSVFSDFYKENELGSLLSDGHPRVWTYEQDEINLKTFLSSWTENPHIVYLLTVMQGFVYNFSI